MNEKNVRSKPNPELWRYYCKKCGKQSNTIERSYEKPFDVKLCSRCGNTMTPKKTTIDLNKKTRETITIKL
jgi:NAD-dependent SIR2 family protein deacetylase